MNIASEPAFKELVAGPTGDSDQLPVMHEATSRKTSKGSNEMFEETLTRQMRKFIS